VRPDHFVDILASEIRDQMAGQVRHFDRLDTRAGVLLGFSGLFVVLSLNGSGFWIAAAGVAGVASAAVALGSFLVRDFPALDVARFRERYVSAEPAMTRLTLVDTHLAILENARRLTHRKVRMLKVTIGAQFVAIVLAVVGVIADNRA
jgi:hypothetical protein